MKTKLIPFLCVFMLATACVKDKLPEATTGTPVFTFSGEIAGQQTSLIAGEGDYYLYATTETDVSGLKSFSGQFAPANCTSCPNSLKITFIDYATSNLIPTAIDSSLYVGQYNFAKTSGQPSRYRINFTHQSLGPLPTGITWDFGDGTAPLTEFDPSHTYVRPGKYEVCANGNFQGGGTSSLCKEVSLGNNGEFCEATQTISPPTGTSFNLSASGVGGTPPYSFYWDLGDGNTRTDQNFSHNYAAEGVYLVTLIMTDANGLISVKRNNVRTANSNDPVLRWSHILTPIANPQNMGNVIVEWRDANGTLYTSNNDNQPLQSEFEVLSIEEYQNNENGQKTKKLRVSFSCTLYNGADQITIRNAEAIIAVAY